MRAAVWIAALAASLGLTSTAQAWTRPGHMVTAAIALDDIQRRRPDLLPQLSALLEAHPDRGPFQVAADRALGAERSRRMFLECARWPDDVRQTPADHPPRHIAFSAVAAADAPPAARKAAAAKRGTVEGEALQALALDLRTLADHNATAGERAQSMCWAIHVLGDLHQPLHTATPYSAAFPNGDPGAAGARVRDPLGGGIISLHWLWDDAVNRSGRIEDVDRRAAELEAAYPRAALPELAAPFDLRQGPDAVWRETFAIAEAFAAREDIPITASESAAPEIAPAVWAALRRQAERRAAIAGYRISEAVIAALDATAAP
ncbi:hypothetical protein LJR225_001499 [Phenylobacterium sp. LjRoot225]|uniref:S1/P1 nuclease n=1 Tax=Phenylobacterium sp. LjRoot225 TaxID=3342285 RepID=UPI003ED126CE